MRLARLLDQRPVLAGVLFVVGWGVAVAAIVFAEELPATLAIVIAFAAGWCSKDAAGSLIRVYRSRRDGGGS